MRLTRCSCLALLFFASSCADRAALPQEASLERPALPAQPTPCTFSAPDEVFIPPSGGPQQVPVTAAPDGCSPDAWSAHVTDSGGSITSLSPTSGHGSGSFTLTASNNSAAPRTGAVRVIPPSHAAPLHIVVRQPNRHCTFNVEANTSKVSELTTSVHVTVTNSEGCSWLAAVSPNPNSFLQFYDLTRDGGMTANGTGTAVLHIRVAENGTGLPQDRSGTVRITSLASGTEVGSVTITQDGTVRRRPAGEPRSRLP